MSNTVRWIVAFLLVALGITSALFSMAILGFTSWGCYKETNDVSLAILYTVMAVSVIGGIVPAIVLLLKADWKFVAAAIGLSILAILAGNGIYVFYNLKIC